MISKRLQAFVLSASLVIGGAVFAAPKKKNDAAKRLDQAGAFLSGAKVTKIKVEKTVVSELLAKTTSSSGEIFVGGGKFRWETEAPDKSTVVFDGKTLWTAQPPPPEFGGATQVTKSSLKGKGKDQVLVKILSGGKLSSKFKVLNSIAGRDDTVLNLAPSSPDPSVKDFSVVLAGKPERIREIRYVDDVGNLTKIRVLKTSAVKKPEAKLFSFEVPKNAEVNEL